jgi:hypothetical protein
VAVGMEEQALARNNIGDTTAGDTVTALAWVPPMPDTGSRPKDHRVRLG